MVLRVGQENVRLHSATSTAAHTAVSLATVAAGGEIAASPSFLLPLLLILLPHDLSTNKHARLNGRSEK